MFCENICDQYEIFDSLHFHVLKEVNVYCYTVPQVTKAPQPGEKRSATSFDIRLSTLNDATVDILFSKNKVSIFYC